MKQETSDTSAGFQFAQEERVSGALTGGFFILMGIIFLLGTTGRSILGFNPWILVALLPAYWIGVAAYRRYRLDGGLSRSVFSILVFGLLPFAYIAAAALGFNVAAIWPLGLIAMGAAFILFGRQQ